MRRTVRCRHPTHRNVYDGKMARPERFELPTTKFVAWYSIQLSYGRVMLRWMRIIRITSRRVNNSIENDGPVAIRSAFSTLTVALFYKSCAYSPSPQKRPALFLFLVFFCF